MSTEHPGDFIGGDWSEIERRALAAFDNGFQAVSAWHAEAKKECFDALMTPTGRRRDG